MTHSILIDNVGEFYSIKLEHVSKSVNLYIFNETECFLTEIPDFKVTEEKCDYPWFSQLIWAFPSCFLCDQRGYTGFVIKKDDKIIMDIVWLLNNGTIPVDMQYVLNKVERPASLIHTPYHFTVWEGKTFVVKDLLIFNN